ncbi:MAG: large repetitive protein [Sphingomonadales bacterium]|jgi:hypothetical protein|nr:large repetitive protein [Sphingomonadales bacterium]
MRFAALLMAAAQASGGTAAAAPSSSGPLSPSIATDLSNDFYPWTNVGNVLVSDNSPATTAPDPANSSNVLRVRGLGFAIPGGATINGVKVDIEAKVSALGGRINSADLATNNLGDSSDQIGTATSGVPATLTTSDAYYTFGGSADLWGSALTPAIVNSANFSVDLTMFTVSGAPTFSVDHVRVTIYYT